MNSLSTIYVFQFFSEFVQIDDSYLLVSVRKKESLQQFANDGIYETHFLQTVTGLSSYFQHSVLVTTKVIKRAYGQFSIETLHERRKRN